MLLTTWKRHVAPAMGEASWVGSMERAQRVLSLNSDHNGTSSQMANEFEVVQERPLFGLKEFF